MQRDVVSSARSFTIWLFSLLTLVTACAPVSPDGSHTTTSTDPSIVPQATSAEAENVVAQARALAQADQALANAFATSESFVSQGAQGWMVGRSQNASDQSHALQLRASSTLREPFTVGLSHGGVQPSVAFVDANPAVAEASSNALVYRNAHASTDVIVTAGVDRAEVFYLVRDASAPRTFAWKLNVPDGYVLRPGGLGSYVFATTSGEALFGIAAPTAVDAKGHRLAVNLTLEEGTLRFAWSPDESTAYPVLVDPIIEVVSWTWRFGLPEKRAGHSLAFDSARNRVVMFGGQSARGDLNDTWEWDGINWSLRTPAHAPTARYDHAMVFDRSRNRIVLFGGTGSIAGVQSDTWEYDGVDWTRSSVTGGPSARYAHAMVYDSARNVTVLFGGNASGSVNDTWEYNGTSWRMVPIATPPPARFQHSMAFDSTRGVTVLYGGLGVLNFLGDTWEYNGTAWTQRTITGAPPGLRGRHAMVFDTVSGRTLLLMGVNNSGIRNDAWELDVAASRWMQLAQTLPPARQWHALTFDSMRNTVFLFGGADANGQFADTWQWNRTEWLAPTPTSMPAPRQQHAMAHDVVTQRTVLFGGLTGVNLRSAETWEWDGVGWSLRTPANPPEARSGHVMVFHAASGQSLLFGGEGTAGLLGDTWQWNSATQTWTRVNTTTAPSARRGAMIAYDPTRSRALMFGGMTSSGASAELWSWSGSAWTRLTTGAGPVARSYGAFVWDRVRDRGILFGGTASSTMGDTWEFDPTNNTWRQFTASAPSPRAGHVIVFDTAFERAFLFGGENNGLPLNDTWEWNGSQWVQRTPSQQPPGTRYGAMAYEDGRGRSMLFSGGSTSTFLNSDSWELRFVRLQGSDCTNNRQCITDHCEDGICCATQCRGLCESCGEAGSVGTCVAVRGQPRGSRAACPGDGSVCASQCNGTDRTSCQIPPPSTICRVASCMNGSSFSEARCDGMGLCLAAPPISCGYFGCTPTFQCKTTCVSSMDCAGNAICQPGGLCAQGVTISPTPATIRPRTNLQFSVVGGTGMGFVFRLVASPSGGMITPSGLYTSGSVENVSDTIEVRDSMNNTGTHTMLVVSVQPDAGPETGVDSSVVDAGDSAVPMDRVVPPDTSMQMDGSPSDGPVMETSVTPDGDLPDSVTAMDAGDASDDVPAATDVRDARRDSGVTPPGPMSCGCRAVGNSSSKQGAWIVIAVGLFVVQRKRRRQSALTSEGDNATP